MDGGSDLSRTSATWGKPHDAIGFPDTNVARKPTPQSEDAEN